MFGDPTSAEFFAQDEMGHALTLRRFGGNVGEMGIIFRYAMIFPYTKIDDVVLLRHRYQQVAVACAGPFVSFVLLVPFAAMWSVAPETSGLRYFTVAIVTLYHVRALLNLVLFVQLDGYHMLALYLRRPQLRIDAAQFMRDGILRRIGRTPSVTRTYSHKDRVLLASYGITSLVVTSAFMGMLMDLWHRGLSRSVGPITGWLLIVGLLLAFWGGRPLY